MMKLHVRNVASVFKNYIMCSVHRVFDRSIQLEYSIGVFNWSIPFEYSIRVFVQSIHLEY